MNRHCLVLEKYERYLEISLILLQELGRSFQHGAQVLATNPILGKQAAIEKERQLVRQLAEGLGLHPLTAPRQSMSHLIEAAMYLPQLQ